MRRSLVVLALLVAPLAAASAQSSEFGVRGLGMPGRPLSTRTFSMGGAFGLFDGESGLNPAALGRIGALGADFTSLQDFRHVENPAGSQSVRETRFPFIAIAGPIKRYPAVLGVSFANYTSRDFTLASVDTLPIRDVLVPVNDTLSSRGGLSDLRMAGAYRIQDDWLIGAAFHIITGTARMRFHRAFADSSYQPLTQMSELSYAGVGVELGVIRNFGPGFSMAATVRSDGHVNVDRDSTRVGPIDLPYSFGFGLRWHARPKLEMASQLLVHTWSGANSDLLEQGGVGSKNNYEASFGLEFTPNLRRPSRRPLRLGVRYGTLPFLLETGEQPKELGVSAGTGIRFAQERAGVDLGLEHVWRTAGAFKERTFLLNLGVMVRP
ncbi:MAG TPA: hypothetical protein VJQ46_05505 [Gemmatimonadales bacterium]|nr:hypothetical protein [Gemmatimonadales bacterium]